MVDRSNRFRCCLIAHECHTLTIMAFLLSLLHTAMLTCLTVKDSLQTSLSTLLLPHTLLNSLLICVFANSILCHVVELSFSWLTVLCLVSFFTFTAKWMSWKWDELHRRRLQLQSSFRSQVTSDVLLAVPVFTLIYQNSPFYWKVSDWQNLIPNICYPDSEGR